MAGDIPTLVFGGGGHGKQVIDLLRSVGGYRPQAVVDDRHPVGSEISGVEVIGDDDALAAAYAQGIRHAINAVGGVTDIDARARVSDRLRGEGFALPTIVHPSAVVEPSAQLGAGCQVHALAYVGSAARLGDDVLVNTTAVVSHDCELGAVTNLSPGALLAGEARTGALVRVGMGATVNIGVTVGERARIGNGATVKADVPAGERVRAGTIWPPS
jgi:sugar O-acyltransferase (sialic acid O-acetyltransferase NeuD family)